MEKPDIETAKRYVRGGKHLWNTGTFIFKASSFLKAIDKFAPDIAAGLFDISKVIKYYKNFPDISIDYAVIEKADNIYCVKGRYRWMDMGSFDSIREILKRERRDFIEKDGKIIKVL